MNNRLKRIVSAIVLIAVLTVSLSFSVFADSRTLKSINDDMEYATSDDEVIKISKASLFKDNQYISDVYVIGLSGSDFSLDPTHINSLFNCFLSTFSLPNSYLSELKSQVKNNIPKDSKIILVGHSLGGMVAQQFSADKEMKEKYDILNTVCMGSPFVFVAKREGKLCRAGDSGDAVPYMSPAGFINAFIGNYIYENTGYFGKPDASHNISYKLSKKWGSYDCLGTKNGTSVLELY